VAAVACGNGPGATWHRPAAPLNFYDLKGILEGLAPAALGAAVSVVPPATPADLPFLDPAAAGRVECAGRAVGVIGRLHPALAASQDLPAAIYLLELCLAGAPVSLPAGAYAPLPRQPAADRDLALVVDGSVPYSRLEAVIRAAGGPTLESAALFDHYAGDRIPPGMVGLAVRLVFRDPERTLTTEEIQAAQERIVARLGSEVGATLRDA
jgi:phenylalanyl-tRNA synthetase beta chain